MVSDFHQQPQQQASKPHRFRTQLPCSTRGSAMTSACNQTHTLRKTKATPTNNSRKTGLRLLVRMRA